MRSELVRREVLHWWVVYRTQRQRSPRWLSLRIVGGKVCHLRDEGRDLEHGSPDQPPGNGAGL